MGILSAVLIFGDPFRSARCSFGLSATSQQYFSLRTNQQPASSTFVSEQISHQPNEHAAVPFRSKSSIDMDNLPQLKRCY
jgi:hypothetical protein